MKWTNWKKILKYYINNDEYLSFKCTKCNKTIFYTLNEPHEESEPPYWMYDNGAEIIPNEIFPDHPWHFLKLTCEEEQIKAILE